MDNTEPKKGNNMGMIMLGIALLLLIGGGIYFMTQSNNTNTAQNQTQEQATPIEDDSMTDSEPTPESDDAMVEGAQTVAISANNFEFSQKEIRVKRGDTVRVTLTNSEGNHDWVLDEFNAKTQVLASGESETIEFVADQAGEFEYYCSVGQHRQMGMVGTLIVE